MQLVSKEVVSLPMHEMNDTFLNTGISRLSKTICIQMGWNIWFQVSGLMYYIDLMKDSELVSLRFGLSLQ